MILEVIAASLILLGLYFYGKKNLAGPACNALGCVAWMVVGVMQAMYPLALLNAVLFVMNCYNFALWYNNEKHVVLTQETEQKGGGDYVRTETHFRGMRH